jgi:type IV secretory pathway TrbD component
MSGATMPALTLRARRKTVIASGLLCCALILVVLFTSPATFRSPAAVVVMTLIGTAAVLLQLRIRNDSEMRPLQSPWWLNVVGILLALAALFPASLRLGPRLTQAIALGAVGSFAISSAIVLHSFRKHSAKPE